MTETPFAAGAVHAPIPHPMAPVAAWLPAPTAGPRLARGFGYLLAGLPVGIVAFVVAVAGFASGVSTLVVWLGLPILVGTLYASRGLATVERRAVCWATGRELPPHHYRPARGHRVARRLLLALADPQSWRDVLHSVVAFPVRVATFSIAVSWAVSGIGGTLYNQTAALRARTEQLAAGRRAAVQAEAQTLRRLERDIHDGPQQRLVRLNMDLETAARRLDDDARRRARRTPSRSAAGP